MSQPSPIIYIYRGANNYMLHIPKPGDKAPKAQKDEYAEITRKLQGRYIRFTPKGTPTAPMSQFVTNDPQIIRLLEKLRKGKPIRVDLSLLPVVCTQCGENFGPRSEESEDALASHVASGTCPGIRPDANDTPGDEE